MKLSILFLICAPMMTLCGEGTVSVGMKYEDAVAAIKHNDGKDVTQDKQIEPPVSGVFWWIERVGIELAVFRDDNGKINRISYWRRQNLGKSKLNTAQTEHRAKSVKIDASSMSFSSEHVADEKPVNVAVLLADVRKLVEKYYPKTEVVEKNGTIHFESNAAKFIVHRTGKGGDRLPDREEIGPRPGGIWCDMEIREGLYGGQAEVPQTLTDEGQDFELYLAAPYSDKHDSYLYVHLKHPIDISEEFLKDFRALLKDFEDDRKY